MHTAILLLEVEQGEQEAQKDGVHKERVVSEIKRTEMDQYHG